MEKLVGSFGNIDWENPGPGIREKKILIASTTIRLVEISEGLEHPEWCESGHIGYVIDGVFTLNIDGKESELRNGDVFVLDGDNKLHRHIPSVPAGGRVLLLLIEETL